MCANKSDCKTTTPRFGLIGGTFAFFLPFLLPNAAAFSAVFLLFAVDSTGDFARCLLETVDTFIEVDTPPPESLTVSELGDDWKDGNGMGDGWVAALAGASTAPAAVLGPTVANRAGRGGSCGCGKGVVGAG